MKRDHAHLLPAAPALDTPSTLEQTASVPLDAAREPLEPLTEWLYQAPRWLPTAHAQTIVPALFAQRPAVKYQRERWTTPDGDFIDLDWLAYDADGENKTRDHSNGAITNASHPASCGLLRNGVATSFDEATTLRDGVGLDTTAGGTNPSPGPAAPLFVLFHGLEGSSDSHYARVLMAEAKARGWLGVVPHFRSCGGSMNLLPRFYHLADSAEVDWVLRRLKAQHPGPVIAAGVSLGGNVLLRWLCEQEQDAAAILDAAAAISAPLDVHAGGHAISQGFGMVYTRSFLKTLKHKALAKLDQYPGLFDRDAMLAARTMHAFDNAVTAPLHGFRDTNDYWTRATTRPYLPRIAIPTLLLNARNDPFLPGRVLPSAAEVSAAVTLDQPAHGGHVGFMTGPFPGRIDWLSQRVFGYLQTHVHHVHHVAHQTDSEHG
ncbi:alpha/beta hydrolase fold protein [Caballeronia sp. SBC1]|uniref:YheT family hydrolase n=1 Tax=Caballeronia sp. SBC1 TaxID=2705548 RepID=UPI00140EE3D8|nr:alpha/beta fold hydrolase [Caballeronia sp. SBC1]QIN60666.1 alpha/beta hydrolase fold protein [Caballeronia sp. SBC1]